MPARTMAVPAAVLRAATAGLAALLLTSCGSPPSATDLQYADAVAAADPDDFGAIPADELASTLGSEGTELCDQLKSSFEAAAAYAKLGFSERQSAALISAAVLVYCPDQSSKIPAQ